MSFYGKQKEQHDEADICELCRDGVNMTSVCDTCWANASRDAISGDKDKAECYKDLISKHHTKPVCAHGCCGPHELWDPENTSVYCEGP